MWKESHFPTREGKLTPMCWPLPILLDCIFFLSLKNFPSIFSDAFCLLLLLFSYSNYCALTSDTVDTREDCLDISIPMLHHALIPSKSSERLGGIPPACCKTDWLGIKDSSLPLKVIQNASRSTWLLHTAKMYNWSCQIFELSLLCVDVQSNWVLLLGTVSLKLC